MRSCPFMTSFSLIMHQGPRGVRCSFVLLGLGVAVRVAHAEAPVWGDRRHGRTLGKEGNSPKVYPIGCQSLRRA